MSRAVLHSAIERVAAEYPDKIAIAYDGSELLYRTLNRRANALAARVRAVTGFDKSGIVGLLLPRGPDLVIAMLAVAKAGGAFMPLDLDAPERSLRARLAKARPRLLIAAGVFDVDVPLLDISEAGDDEGDDPTLAVDGDDAAYVVFTSGSTGIPKAILGTHKGLSHFVHWEVAEFAVGSRDRVSLLAPPTFDVCLRDVFVPLLAGGTLCIPPAARDVSGLLEWLEAEAVTLVHCVPSLFRAMMDQLAAQADPHRRLGALRYVLLAGEPLYGADVMRWAALTGGRAQLVNLYGPSETTLAKAFYRIEAPPADPGRMIPVGRPLPNTALLVIRDGELCDIGEIGEIYIRTSFMSRGYLGDPALTADAFVQNPLTPDRADTVYRTGDLGRYRQDRCVEFLGRKDGQVKVNGVRIELGEIEQALLQHASIKSAVAVAHTGDDRQTYVTAYYVPRERFEEDELRAHAARFLPAAMLPAYFVEMEQFPLNLHGKVNRRALPRPAELLYRRHAYVAPAAGDEAELAAIWSEVLQLPRIGADHGFAELGGDSLKAIRTIARIYHRLGVEVGLLKLFPGGTIRSLAAQIRETRSTQDATIADALKRDAAS